MRKKGRYSEATREPQGRSRLLRGSLPLEVLAWRCWDRGSGLSSSRRLWETETQSSDSQLFWDDWEEKGFICYGSPVSLPLSFLPIPADTGGQRGLSFQSINLSAALLVRTQQGRPAMSRLPKSPGGSGLASICTLPCIPLH